MSVHTKQALTRREYDFSNLQLGSESVVAARSIGVAYGEIAELLVRVHDVNIAASCLVEVIAVPVSITNEEPSVDYLGSAVATVTLDDTTSAPDLRIQAFSTPFGQAIQLQIKGTCAVAPGTIKATISVDIVCKD